MTDATRKCPVCGAILPSAAKFCGECGTSLKPAHDTVGTAGGTVHSRNPVLPWFLAGCAALAVHAAVIIVAVRGRTVSSGVPMSAEASPSTDDASPGSGRAPDISNLSPREAADRLYNRIARASEAGDTAQVNFFAPMAINAYANVTPLDADARLHIGLIQLGLGNAAAALAQADSITRFSAMHLFGPMLKSRAAEAAGDRAAMREAYRAFLANYDAEMRKDLPEYQQHPAELTATRTAAQGAGSR
jgi:hypothetical protein